MAAASAQDVALVTRARTRDAAGNELGVFTAGTRPTATDVDGLIGLVAGQVASIVGSPMPAVLDGEARMAIIYGVAALIEEGFFPEQNAGPDSPAARHHDRFRQSLEQLERSYAAYSAGGSRGGGVGLGSMTIRAGSAVGV